MRAKTMADTYSGICKECEEETDLINGACMDCAENHYLDGEEARATGN